MSDHVRTSPSPTFVAAALLLLLLTALAVLDAAPVTPAAATCSAPAEHQAALTAQLSAVLRNAPPARAVIVPYLDGIVAGCDLGFDPHEMIASAGDLLLQAAPQLHASATSWIAEFSEWSGLSPASDLLPYLESDLTLALYPARRDDVLWPLPRPVVVLRIAEPAPVARFVSQWTRWKAAAVAPFTGGLLGAAATTGELAGYPFFGLDMDSLAQLPLPAPTAVVLDRLLVISPSRTAAEEAASSLAARGVEVGRSGRR